MGNCEACNKPLSECRCTWEEVFGRPYRGHVFYTTRLHGPGCRAISVTRGALCNNGEIVYYKSVGLRLCAAHAGMLQAGWVFHPDPMDSGDKRW